MKVVIPMPPKSKGRPRFSRGHAYTPSETRKYEEAVRLIAENAIKAPLERPLKLAMHFYMEVPKSWSKRKRESALNGEIRPASKPDIDNLCKAIMDALNGGIGYNDDKQIVELHAYEWYGEPRTEIILEEIR